MNFEWEKHVGPGGHWQWRKKDSDSKLMRLTSDISLLHDEKYRAYVEHFANDMDAFNRAFEEAWFDLTTTYGSGIWSKNAKCDIGEFPEALHSMNSIMRSDDVEFVAMAQGSKGIAFVAIASVAVSAMFFVAVFCKHGKSELEERMLTAA